MPTYQVTSTDTFSKVNYFKTRDLIPQILLEDLELLITYPLENTISFNVINSFDNTNPKQLAKVYNRIRNIFCNIIRIPV